LYCFHINYASDSYWGNPERYQFRARIDSFATPVQVEQKGERSVKATFTLKLYGYLVPDTVLVFNRKITLQNSQNLNNNTGFRNIYK